MKLGVITKPNEKGQIVIPKEMRKLLGISVNDLLHLFVRGGGLFIQPISDVGKNKRRLGQGKNNWRKAKKGC